jgi:flagellar L-ring protein precursor FlgH
MSRHRNAPIAVVAPSSTAASTAAVSAAAALISGCLAGCGGMQHIRPHTARHREYEPGAYEQASTSVSEGSLWQDGSRGLFADFRAGRVGDLVTVRIDEDPHAMGGAGTQVDREANYSLGVDGLFGLTTALARAYPDLDPTRLVGLMSSSSFDGHGQTSRSSRLEAAVAVRVRRVLPNGDLFVEGTKVLLVNDEELHIYLSGVIRPQDIAQDNSISSGSIADAEVEFTGRGDLSQTQRQGWLARLLAEITPF